jgi:predicted RNA methylase
VELINITNNTTDADFDKAFKSPLALISNLHWTPIKVARKAIQWLSINKNSNILDVGSGTGKFCIIGALTTNNKYTGVEQRKNLVKLSNKVIKLNAITNAEFINDNFININFNEFTGFYLYNPFWENISNDQLIDQKIEVSQILYQQYNQALSLKLSALKQGTLVVTYLMNEESIPTSYSIIKQDFNGSLLLWQKS